MKTLSALLLDISNTALVGISVFCAVIKVYFLKYIFNDFEFGGFLVFLVVLDSLLGIWFAVKRKDFDPRSFGQFCEKIVLYFCVLVVGHILSNYTIDGKHIDTFRFMKTVLYNAMVIREVTSILKFVSRKYPGFLRDILKYFRGYNAEGLPESTTKKP